MESLQSAEEKAIADEIKLLFRTFELEMEKLHEKLSFQLDVIKINAGIGILFYIEKLREM